MSYKIIYRLTLVSLMFMSACSRYTEIKPISSPTTRLTATKTAMPAYPDSIATITRTSMPTRIPVAAATPSPIPTVTPSLEASCQVPAPVQPGDSLPLLQSGSILVQPIGKAGVWAIPPNASKPYLIAAPVKPRWRFDLSLSGTKLIFSQPGEPISIYDLLTREGRLIPWQDSWHVVWKWSTDERIQILIRFEETLGEGVLWEVVLLDPVTLRTETMIHDARLPNYSFNDANPLHGFASWSPSEPLVLYTADAPNKPGGEYVLRNIATNEELWQSEAIGGSIIPIADWSKNGDRVLMVIIPHRLINDPEKEPSKLVSLNVDSLDYEVLSQLTFLSSTDYIRYIEWSSDTRYVLFELWEMTGLGPGYILDTDSGVVRQICEPSFINGWWLPDVNQILYIIQTDTGRELKLLDVTKWQAQSLWQTDNNLDSSRIIGWTPVVFPVPTSN